MNDLDDIKTRLDTLKSDPVPTGRGFDAAVTRGRRHRRNTRIGNGVAAAGLSALAVVAVMNVSPAATLDAPDVAASDGVTSEGTTATAASLSVEWQAVAETVGQGTPVFGADGALYVVSTAPGATYEDGTEGVLWTSSDDGETWSRVATPDGVSLTDVFASDDALYVVGTAPGSADVGAVSVGVSADGGSSWDGRFLDLRASAPADIPIVGNSQRTLVASAPGRTLVLAQTTFYVDGAAFVPEDLNLDPEFLGVATEETGVVVYDWSGTERVTVGCESGTDSPDTCPLGEPDLVWEATWEELGISPADLEFDELFVSVDGGAFEPLDFPEQLDLVSIDWAADAFYGLVDAGGRMQVWRSIDGTDWQPTGDLPGGYWANAIGAVGDTLVSVIESYGEGGPTSVVTSTDGGITWLAIPVGDLGMEPTTSFVSWSTGPSGMVIGGGPYDGGPIQLASSSDAMTWEVTTLDDLPQGTSIDGVAVAEDVVFANTLVWDPSAEDVDLIGRITD